MPVHLPEVLVGDDVDEDVDRVHPPVPGVAHQVPEHINLCQVKLSIVDVKTKKFFQIKNYFVDLHAQLHRKEDASENGIGEREEHKHRLIFWGCLGCSEWTLRMTSLVKVCKY